MFSRTTEYALRAIAFLAEHAPAARTTEQIAQATKVPPAYLSKVLQALSRARIVRSQRGIGGGIALVARPDQLTILDVVNAVDPINRIRRCPLDLAAHGVRLCPLHSRLDAALATVEEAFASTTLADLLADSSGGRRRCKFPRVRVN